MPTPSDNGSVNFSEHAADAGSAAARPSASPPPANDLGASADDPGSALTNRRHFLLAGLGVLLAGCGSQRTGSMLPGPSWRVQQAHTAHRNDAYPPASSPPSRLSGDDGGVISRTAWSPGTAAPAHMQPMNGIRYITVHHDGIGPFYDQDERASRQRLESIRRFHRDNRGWGDIGYHYIIDRNGRIWEGRSLAYQGAHVGNHNENNIGVLLMGNFDQQSPSDRQLAAMHQHVSSLMRRYHVPLSRVTTHREWETARTACPGHTLQAHMDYIRSRRVLG